MARAVCPGSFDPPTLGHLDIIRRAAALFDELTVAVLVNERKAGMFSVDERLQLLREVVADLDNVTVDSFSGLLVDYCAEHDVRAVVKGLRAAADFDYELQMAQMNEHLSGVETVFLATSPGLSYVASSLVKEVARFGGDVQALVPSHVASRLASRLGRTPSTGDSAGS